MSNCCPVSLYAGPSLLLIPWSPCLKLGILRCRHTWFCSLRNGMHILRVSPTIDMSIFHQFVKSRQVSHQVVPAWGIFRGGLEDSAIVNDCIIIPCQRFINYAPSQASPVCSACSWRCIGFYVAKTALAFSRVSHQEKVTAEPWADHKFFPCDAWLKANHHLHNFPYLQLVFSWFLKKIQNCYSLTNLHGSNIAAG